MKLQRISILLCTYRRESVRDTLASLSKLQAPQGCFVNIIVADNDVEPSAEHIVGQADQSWPVTYVHAPAGNISIARNACLDHARRRQSDWIAFVDDDEVVGPDWLQKLMGVAVASGVDVVSGPAIAQYPSETPEWMVEQDWHSNWPALRMAGQGRQAKLQTSHTCNALVRFWGTPWVDQNFDVRRGTSGGEDTAYFFDVSRSGARFNICPDAVAEERVAPERLTLAWLTERRFRMGQTYSAAAVGPAELARLTVSASAKAIYCQIGIWCSGRDTARQNFWILRGALHKGVVAGCFARPQARLYGAPAADPSSTANG
ncbi:glycosyltransferase family 2 protein [Phaeobacter sp.]|uniref:glycosyltransferase family 2 protein n=1 Tax=Phaeobacter sp. TaxID=1902409 RepID=UPI0025D73124|nr:glycosyltransferase family 2 protein [Phaeobacter sp.]